MCINDLSVNVGDMISKFADDSKIGVSVHGEEDIPVVRNNIDRLVNWDGWNLM